MPIRGWTRTSLLDFPGHIASVLFYGGCNFRCPMCHNGDLVLHPQVTPEVPAEEILAFLKRRQGKITGVVLTGGEPTLHPSSVDFVRELRALGYAIKLDTNGYRPQVLAALLAAHLVDYVAMDIKSPPQKYDVLAGLEGLDLDRITESIGLLAKSGLPHEYRTTVVPTLLLREDITSLVEWLVELDGGDYDYYLQQFRGGHTLSAGIAGLSPYPLQALLEMQQSVIGLLPRTRIRGV